MHGTDYPKTRTASASDAFRHMGRVQQYGAFLMRIAFLLDAGVLYCTLFLSVHLHGVKWGQRYVTLALLGIIVTGLVTSFRSRSLNRTWRLEQLRHELTETAIVLVL